MKVPFNLILFLLIHVPNIILGAVDDDGDYDGNANYDHDQVEYISLTSLYNAIQIKISFAYVC